MDVKVNGASIGVSNTYYNGEASSPSIVDSGKGGLLIFNRVIRNYSVGITNQCVHCCSNHIFVIYFIKTALTISETFAPLLTWLEFVVLLQEILSGMEDVLL